MPRPGVAPAAVRSAAAFRAAGLVAAGVLGSVLAVVAAAGSAPRSVPGQVEAPRETPAPADVGAGAHAEGAGAHAGDAGIHGFHRDSLARQRQLEAAFLALPDPARLEEHARVLSAAPHVAGTPANEAVARYIRDRFVEAGLRAEMVSYSVYMGHVDEASLEQVAPEPRVLATPEEGTPSPGGVPDPAIALHWNAYAPSCDLTREVVYANHANPADFDFLESMGIEVRGRIVLARHFHGYRGGKALEAERRGAAALVLFSDPADDGYGRGAVYPDGPWGPPGHFQRGATAYDFIVPGDPLTPGWASKKGARRIAPERAASLPRIPSIPISGRDAQVILESLAGAAAPRAWQGRLPVTYHLGPGPSRVRLRIKSTFTTRPITNVIGILRGTDEPERLILLSNHHDAWVHGSVDPVSGTASMIELARAMGDLARRGLRPRRTLVFGNWDAEEWTLTGSTEWGEDRREDLSRHAVACLNFDSAVSGRSFAASAVPSLRRLIDETLRDVADPETGRDLLGVVASARPAEGMPYFAPEDRAGASVAHGILGSGSDYTVFFNHLGIPSIDASFDGPYGVYHSVLDNHDWMTRFGDPGFLYHAAATRVWGLMAYRLANADILPFEETPYAADVERYVAGLFAGPGGAGAGAPPAPAPAGDAEIEPPPARPALPDLAPLRAAIGRWKEEARSFDAAVAEALAGPRPSRAALARVNTALIQSERNLLEPGGIPGRPWFRHLIYAPLPTYAAETLPGVREALAEGDLRRAGSQAGALTGAIGRRITTLAGARRALAAATVSGTR